LKSLIKSEHGID